MKAELLPDLHQNVDLYMGKELVFCPVLVATNVLDWCIYESTIHGMTSQYHHV